VTSPALASPAVVVGTRARHLLAEYHGCELALLNDVDAVRALMRRAALAAGATVVAEVFHPYRPHGVTGVLVIEESHFSVHTWPECGYAAVDFYTCGDCRPELADEVLREGLQCARSELLVVERGIEGPEGSLKVAEHRRSARVAPDLVEPR
jgi:S-adenosylmethionine decarboxylase